MYRVPEAVRVTHQQDGAVVLDLRRGQMFSLNLVGSKIVQLLAIGRDVPTIQREISRQFGLDEQIVRSDVGEFIEALCKCNLLEESFESPESRVSAPPSLLNAPKMSPDQAEVETRHDAPGGGAPRS